MTEISEENLHCMGLLFQTTLNAHFWTCNQACWEISADSYLADPTSPVPSHCAAIILFKNVPVHQLPWLALLINIVNITNVKYYTNQTRGATCWQQTYLCCLFLERI